MAKTANKSSGPAKKLSNAQLRKIWAELKPETFLEKLRAAIPDGRWSLSGRRINGRCPYHDDDGPSFYVYLDRGYAKCFGCSKYVSNPVTLWAHARGSSGSDALNDLRTQFGLKFLTRDQTKQLDAWEQNQALKRRIMRICHSELLDTIQTPDDPVVDEYKAAVDWLLNVRKISAAALPNLNMVGLFPPLARMINLLEAETDAENRMAKQLAELNGTEFEAKAPPTLAVQEYLGGKNGNGWANHRGSIIFRMDIAPDVVGRLKLRRPHTKEMVMIDDPFEEEVGFFGLGWEQYRTTQVSTTPEDKVGVYVVEGEFDALTPMSRMLDEDGSATLPIVAAGGNANSADIDLLKSAGYDDVYLVGDAPSNKGDELVKSWLSNIRELRCKIFVGYEHFIPADDPDKMVLHHGLSAVKKALLAVNDRNFFLPPHEWLFEQAQPEVEAIDETEMRRRVEVVAELGRYLKNPVDCDAFVDACVKEWGFSLSTLKREIVSKNETEAAYILRTAEAFKREFFVIGQEPYDSNRRLYLWHRETGQITWVNLADDGHAERQLAPISGPQYLWYTEKLGIPDFLEVSEEKKENGTYLQELDKKLKFYTREALMLCSMGAPNYLSAPHRGQGLHVEKDPDGGVPTLYLVNGKDVYRGTFDELGKLLWTQLEGPSDRGIIFDVGLKRFDAQWMRSVNRAKDLMRGANTNLVDVLSRLESMLDIGWRFQNHSLAAEFLAAHMLASTVSTAFSRGVTVAVHADSSSGKSRLVMGLISGRDFPRIHVLSAATGMSNFTAAGIKQSGNNVSRPLVLDEFEDEGGKDKRSQAVTEVLNLIRGQVGADNSGTQGSRAGEAVVYHLNFFMYVAAIRKPRQTQDANRMIALNLQHVTGRADPVQIILNDLGHDFVNDLRNDIDVCMFHRVPELMKTYEELEREFHVSGTKPAGVDSRYFEALLPALTVMKLAGKDYKKFAADFCAAHADPNTTNSNRTDSQSLMDWVFQSPQLRAPLGPNGQLIPVTLNLLLAAPETRQMINMTSSGLYWDEASATVVVNWIQAQQSVLINHPKYNKELSTGNLRDMAQRATFAMSTEELVKTGALNRLKTVGLHGISPNQLTGYRVNHLLPTSTSAEAPVVPPKSENMPTGAVEKKDDNVEFN